MQITAVGINRPSYNYYRSKTNNSQSPSFKSALSELEVDRIINTLSKKNTEVIENFTKSVLDRVIFELTSRYRSKNVNSVGIIVAGNNHLPKLLGKDFAKYDTKGKVGLCIAVGDTYGPIEKMKNIYEAKTILTTMDALKK